MPPTLYYLFGYHGYTIIFPSIATVCKVLLLFSYFSVSDMDANTVTAGRSAQVHKSLCLSTCCFLSDLQKSADTFYKYRVFQTEWYVKCHVELECNNI